MIGKYVVRIQWNDRIEQERSKDPCHISIYDYLKLSTSRLRYDHYKYGYTERIDQAATFDSVDEAKNAIKEFVSYSDNMDKYFNKIITFDIVLIKEEVVYNVFFDFLAMDIEEERKVINGTE